MHLRTLLTLPLLLLSVTVTAAPEKYVIDTEGSHAYIQFTISHLGFSHVIGRFNDFEGSFTYDPENAAAASVRVDIDPASIDSNHAERDKHLRGEDFLHVEKYPEAGFVSTSYTEHEDGTGVLKGELTLHGVTRPVTIETRKLGEGVDPWGDYRRGFEGSTELRLADFGIDYDLGPAAKTVEIYLSLEGIRRE